MVELTREAEINAITQKVIGCAYTVSNHLGSGFLEKVYENAMAHELRKSGLGLEQQHPIQVWYDGVTVVEFFAKILVEETVLVELKTVRSLEGANLAQCWNYL